MNRRDFLRRAGLVAAGVVAADQLDLLERLTHVRCLWPGHDFGKPVTLLDMAKSLDPDTRRVIEMLSQQNEILDDMARQGGRLSRGARRTGLPAVAWRLCS